MILFAFGIGVGLLRNNLKKPAQEKEIIDSSLSINENKNVFNEVLNQDGKKKFSINQKLFSQKIQKKFLFQEEK